MPELMINKTLSKVDTTNIIDIDEILKKRKGQLFIKRIFDSSFSLLGLFFLLPVFLVISILITIDSKGPVLFKQVRVGKNGKEFKILKFRTMVVDAEKKGMQITVGKDSRITTIGHILRKSKMDELPQLINVFIGDMSFVGPRPEVPKYVTMYNSHQSQILKVRPGITDLASIEYRDENTLLAQSSDPEKLYINEIMPKKINLNIKYLKKISVIYDMRLIFKTVFVIIRQK